MTKTATDTEVADMEACVPITDAQEGEVGTSCTRITWNQSGERTSHKESARNTDCFWVAHDWPLCPRGSDSRWSPFPLESQNYPVSSPRCWVSSE